MKKAKKLDSIIDWGQSAGKRTGLLTFKIILILYILWLLPYIKTSLIEFFQGIVTTARLTHATPAALYAHVPHRYWECDAGLKRDNGYGTDNLIAPGEDNPKYNETLDIARQLVYDETGIKTNVLLGGGLRSFKP